jgi:hypothetical protein
MCLHSRYNYLQLLSRSKRSVEAKLAWKKIVEQAETHPGWWWRQLQKKKKKKKKKEEEQEEDEEEEEEEEEKKKKKLSRSKPSCCMSEIKS